ncbi:MAG: hypothetical protein QXH51_07915 [Candidatus Bathyarchaeia archaeon]
MEDRDPEDYIPRWFAAFQGEVYSRLTALETEISHVKASVDDLRKHVTELLRSSQNIQHKTQIVVSSWRQVLALVGSIVGSVVLATYLAYILRVILGG